MSLGDIKAILFTGWIYVSLGLHSIQEQKNIGILIAVAKNHNSNHSSFNVKRVFKNTSWSVNLRSLCSTWSSVPVLKWHQTKTTIISSIKKYIILLYFYVCIILTISWYLLFNSAVLCTFSWIRDAFPHFLSLRVFNFLHQPKDLKTIRPAITCPALFEIYRKEFYDGCACLQ